MPGSHRNHRPASLSRAERAASGKALRKQVPRESHADLTLAAGRDPAALLAAVDANRIAALLPIRYERMLASPFTFLRGAASVMAADLAGMPVPGIAVQACGDCHLLNFGAFGTPEGRILFDINDFDETLGGIDFTVDLKRLVASVAVAALDAGYPKKKARSFAAATAQAYCDHIRALAGLSPLAIWHSRIDLAREAGRIAEDKLRQALLKTIVKAKKTLAQDDNFPHLAKTRGNVCRIEDRPPLIYHLDAARIRSHGVDSRDVLSLYQANLPPDRQVLLTRFRLEDLAFKVVGVGSVGTFCAIGLYMTGDGEPLFLQIKEAQASVLERFRPGGSGIRDQGRRVVEGQRVMQAASDAFLGSVEDPASGRHFYVRQLKNRRLGSVGELLEGNALLEYAVLCGRTLARAHARSGDPAVIAGYVGRSGVFEDALAAFSLAYADQTAADHAALKHAQPAARRRARRPA
ncbi:hypothetical protein BN1110_02340 [bacterium YEK0313]|nr:hypothetical protein BN1110_02340 [bacterium YEK0313]